MKYHLIINPHGGAKTSSKILEKVKPYFVDANAELNIIETDYAGHARDISREVPFEGYSGLCAIGGDGTMHEMLNGLMKRPTPTSSHRLGATLLVSLLCN